MAHAHWQRRWVPDPKTWQVNGLGRQLHRRQGCVHTHEANALPPRTDAAGVARVVAGVADGVACVAAGVAADVARPAARCGAQGPPQQTPARGFRRQLQLLQRSAAARESCACGSPKALACPRSARTCHSCAPAPGLERLGAGRQPCSRRRHLPRPRSPAPACLASGPLHSHCLPHRSPRRSPLLRPGPAPWCDPSQAPGRARPCPSLGPRRRLQTHRRPCPLSGPSHTPPPRQHPMPCREIGPRRCNRWHRYNRPARPRPRQRQRQGRGRRRQRQGRRAPGCQRRSLRVRRYGAARPLRTARSQWARGNPGQVWTGVGRHVGMRGEMHGQGNNQTYDASRTVLCHDCCYKQYAVVGEMSH